MSIPQSGVVVMGIHGRRTRDRKCQWIATIKCTKCPVGLHRLTCEMTSSKESDEVAWSPLVGVRSLSVAEINSLTITWDDIICHMERLRPILWTRSSNLHGMTSSMPWDNIVQSIARGRPCSSCCASKMCKADEAPVT